MRRAIKPPSRVTRCPDCRGRVHLVVKSNGSGWERWRCANIRGCGSAGPVLADGHLAVAERYRLRHEPPAGLLDLGVHVLPRIVASGLRQGYTR